MFAAVVTAFDQPPRYQQLDAPAPTGSHETVVEVIAAGLHPRVRSQSNGTHYTSTDQLPLVPGIDGVGWTSDGQLRYFVLPDTTMGSMAERTVIDLRRSIPLPEGADPLAIAAAMNPAMSSWVALRRRIDFEPGQSVLVLGATGSSGALAVQVAKRLGAGRVVAAGRDAGRLAATSTLGADVVVSLEGDFVPRLGELAGDIDVVLDYVWGATTAAAMTAIVTARTDRDRPLTWIEIGSVAGRTAEIPSAALRAARLQLVGSGQGSVPTRDIVAELPALAAEIANGTFTLDVRAVPLAEIESAWSAVSGQERIVITP